MHPVVKRYRVAKNSKWYDIIWSWISLPSFIFHEASHLLFYGIFVLLGYPVGIDWKESHFIIRIAPNEYMFFDASFMILVGRTFTGYKIGMIVALSPFITWCITTWFLIINLNPLIIYFSLSAFLSFFPSEGDMVSFYDCYNCIKELKKAKKHGQ